MQNSILNITQHEQGTNSVEALAFYGAIVSHLNPRGSEKFPCGGSKDLKVSTRSKWASGASVGSAVYKDCECGRNLHGQHILHILGPLPGSTPVYTNTSQISWVCKVQYERNTSVGNCFEVLLMVKILWKYCAWVSFRKGKEPSKGLKEPFTQWSSNRARFHRRGQSNFSYSPWSHRSLTVDDSDLDMCKRCDMHIPKKVTRCHTVIHFVFFVFPKSISDAWVLV